ncbi:MAG: hypothetical protein ACI9GB_002195 [Halioglobus sp.]|jgi:hypothetical protein
MLSPGKDALAHATYERPRPEQTLLYQLVDKHYPALIGQLESQGESLPAHVHREFEAYLKCGRLEHWLLWVRCDKCQFEWLVAFSCKKRGFCPSCGARRMAETAALLADRILAHLESEDATEKRVARTVAYSPSGMNGYKLRDHLSEQIFRAIGGYFANFSSSINRISEEIYSRQAVYLSYTS